jgi:hypothetical protein
LEGRALQSAAYDESCRLIRDVDPPMPSTRLSTMGDRAAEVARRRSAEPASLGKLIRGDLDWIVMKALEKDRTRRYETATDLAKDIQRHLSDQPVAAGPPTAGYRVRKFVRRHRVGVVSASLLPASLIAGLAAATAGFVRPSREKAKADGAAARALAAKHEADLERQRAEDQRATAEKQRRVAEGLRTQSDKQRLQARRVLAWSQLDRGLDLVNEGEARGLLDLLDARITAEGVPELRESAGRFWAMAYALWADRLVHVLKTKMFGGFSPDGKWLAAHVAGFPTVWEVGYGLPGLGGWAR